LDKSCFFLLHILYARDPRPFQSLSEAAVHLSGFLQIGHCSFSDMKITPPYTQCLQIKCPFSHTLPPLTSCSFLHVSHILLAIYLSLLFACIVRDAWVLITSDSLGVTNANGAHCPDRVTS